MMMIKLLFVLNSVFAGNGNVVGNGGFIVACPGHQSSEIFSNGIAFYDLYEDAGPQDATFKHLRSFRSLKFEEAFPQAVNLFLRHDPSRRERMLQRFSRFSRQTRFSNEDLDGVLPSWKVFSNNCEVKQAAVQYGHTLPRIDEPMNLVIVKKIWNRLTTDQKIALIFHEYLVKDYIFAENMRFSYAWVLSTNRDLLSDQGLQRNGSN